MVVTLDVRLKSQQVNCVTLRWMASTLTTLRLTGLSHTDETYSYYFDLNQFFELDMIFAIFTCQNTCCIHSINVIHL